MLKDWEHQEEEMVYPYAFFKTSDGATYIESENWSMRCHVTNTYVNKEFNEFIENYPERKESAKEEFGDWLKMSITQRKKLKREWFKKEENMNGCCEVAKSCEVYSTAPGWTNIISGHTHSFSLDNCKANYPTPTVAQYNNEEGKNPMYATNEAEITQTQRKYLQNQTYDLKAEKIENARKAFHMEPVGPTNVKEFVEWIKADNFEVKKEAENHDAWSFFHVVKWVDKANKPDEAGYDTARKAIDKAYKDTERVIKIKSPEAGLDALTAFESATFH